MDPLRITTWRIFRENRKIRHVAIRSGSIRWISIRFDAILYNFIAPSRRNDAHNKCNLRMKPNNLDPVKKGIELQVCCNLQYITV